MIVRTFIMVAALVAVPMAVVGAAEPAAKRSGYSTKRTCEVSTPLGSRLGGVRRCRTAAERDQHKQEARQVVDEIQSFKATMCAPPRPAC